MLEWLSTVAQHFPIVGAWIILTVSCMCVGWYGHVWSSRILSLEKYRIEHSLISDIGFDRIKKLEETTIQIGELLKHHDAQLTGHDREILRLRDWKDRHGG